MKWALMSSVEQMTLVALSDDGSELAQLARGADQLERDIAGIVMVVDQLLGRLDASDPVRVDLEEIREAAMLATRKLEELSHQSCKPQLWLVP